MNKLMKKQLILNISLMMAVCTPAPERTVLHYRVQYNSEGRIAADFFTTLDGRWHFQRTWNSSGSLASFDVHAEDFPGKLELICRPTGSLLSRRLLVLSSQNPEVTFVVKDLYSRSGKRCTEGPCDALPSWNVDICNKYSNAEIFPDPNSKLFRHFKRDARLLTEAFGEPQL